ncbi:MAG: A/G-specific adenine glycosylase [Pseudomonadota bacterium]
MGSFASRLIAWQRRHGRHDLPWQGADAYRVWLSEVMLQQTQVATVIPYYQRFVASFPTVNALAAASEEQVLAHWSGLGYYARGRNLHRAARMVVGQHGGRFPQEFDAILALPGIGRSTAAAICALAFRQRRAILDGNVKRLLARYCGIDGWTGDKKIERQLWERAEALLPQRNVATYTQALMDMGATLCTRSRPKCANCPLQRDCSAFNSNRVSALPTPRPHKAIPQRHSTFLLLLHGTRLLLEKRDSQGIWGGLWCPPQFADEVAALTWCAQQGIRVEHCGAALPAFTHTFTHFKLHITPLLLRVQDKPQCAQQSHDDWPDIAEARQRAIPAPVRQMLEKLGDCRTSNQGNAHSPSSPAGHFCKACVNPA